MSIEPSQSKSGLAPAASRKATPVQSEAVGKNDGLERVPVGASIHWELVQFLEDEATLLDDNELFGWLKLMSPELVYQMPVRTTRDRVDGPEFSEGMYHFDEDFLSLSTKVTRLAATRSAWAEKPPSRTRRFVTNIKVFRPAGSEGDRFEVRSSVLLVRNRYRSERFDLVSARRTDSISKQAAAFKLFKRTIFVDQATIGTQNMAVFL